MPQPQKFGRKQRMSFSKIETVLPMPNLIQIQKDSYDWFIKEGLAEVLRTYPPSGTMRTIWRSNSSITTSPTRRSTIRKSARRETLLMPRL